MVFCAMAPVIATIVKLWAGKTRAAKSASSAGRRSTRSSPAKNCAARSVARPRRRPPEIGRDHLAAVTAPARLPLVSRLGRPCGKRAGTAHGSCAATCPGGHCLLLSTCARAECGDHCQGVHSGRANYPLPQPCLPPAASPASSAAAMWESAAPTGCFARCALLGVARTARGALMQALQ